MHVIQARKDPNRAAATMAPAQAYTTGSGLDKLAATISEPKAPSAPGSKRSTTQADKQPSTRHFANNMAAFYGESQVTDGMMAKAKELKSEASKPSTR